MAKTLQFRRGTTGDLASVTGAEAEIFIDTTKKTVVVMDGSTAGGTPLATEASVTGDVVFDSALIGDVSIVSNTIAGVDAYGLADTLIVEGNLNVDFGAVSTTTQTVYPYNFGNSGVIFQLDGSGNYFYIQNTPNGSQTDVSVFSSGQTVSITGQYGNYTFVLTSDMIFNGQWFASCVLTSGTMTGSVTIYGFSGLGVQVTTPVDTRVTALAVTATGVNVEGTFTVNGAAITGGSFDGGSLVATDALIGDVSIVGNTIAGVDAYGVSDTLVVDGNVNVFTGESVQSTQTVTTTTTIAPDSFEYNGQQIVISASANISLEDIEAIDRLVYGDVIAMSNISVPSQGFITSTGSIQVFSTQRIDLYTVAIFTNTFMLDGYGNYQATNLGSNISSSQWTWSQSQTVTTDTPVATLVADAAGVAVIGALTVNGQEITPSVTYDQELNTTDDVVFNTALVGDVSIVANTIAALDAYGLSDTLIVNGGLNVTFGEQSTATRTINRSSYQDGYFFYEGNASQFRVQSGNVNGTETVATDIPLGSLVAIPTNYGDVVIQLTTTPTFDAGTWNAQAVVISGQNTLAMAGNSAASFNNITVTTSIDTLVTPMTVTETGVNITGDFTVNGAPITGGFDGGSLVATDALIGDVSIVANTVAALDAYGLSDTLVVNGGLNVTFGGQSTQTVLIDSTSYRGNDYFFYTNSNGIFRLTGGGYLNGTETVATDIPLGSLVTLPSNYGDVVVQLTSTLTYNGSGAWTATAIVVSGSANLQPQGDQAFSSGPTSVTTSIDTLVTPMTVTETGVTVTGTLNGAVAYTPTTAGDWNGTAPTTIGEAIDRLAALVKTLNSGTGA